MEFYEVGGCVRDEILGVQSKDIDYSVVFPGGSYDELLAHLDQQGFERFLPLDGPDQTDASLRCREALTVRAKFPKGLGLTFAGRDVDGMAADFVLARKESGYSDGRHPDKVEPGTLLDDLRRRDFTMNAIAKDSHGRLIDPFGGQDDLANKVIRTVGDPEERFGEDGLRALRAIRFAITKEMTLDGAVFDALRSEWLPPLLAATSVERRSQELLKAFRHDTLATMRMLQLFPDLADATFKDGLWLMPTLKG